MSESGGNKAVIGAFVVGAVVLAVLGVIVFGGGKLFTKTNLYVMYFEGSVKGLNVGAPVVLRGVQIGSVKSIQILADATDTRFRIPVVVEIEPERIQRTGEVQGTVAENLKRLIDAGLRARLNMQSMVTGLLMVELEFLPDDQARLTGFSHEYPEVPTVPSTFERIAKKLESLPIDEIFNKLSSSLTAFEAFMQNPALWQSVDRFNQAVADLDGLIKDVDREMVPLLGSARRTVDNADKLILDTNGQVDRLGGEAQNALHSASAALNQLQQFLTFEHGEPAKVAESIRKAADGVRPALEQAANAFGNIADMTGKDAQDRLLLDRTLKELSDAARSIRIWAEYLERHPEALISGKGGPKREVTS